jgi:hypothetical protein
MFENTFNSMVTDNQSFYLTPSYRPETPIFITEPITHIIDSVYASTSQLTSNNIDLEQEISMWQAASSKALVDFEAMLDDNCL